MLTCAQRREQDRLGSNNNAVLNEIGKIQQAMTLGRLAHRRFLGRSSHDTKGEVASARISGALRPPSISTLTEVIIFWLGTEASVCPVDFGSCIIRSTGPCLVPWEMREAHDDVEVTLSWCISDFRVEQRYCPKSS